MTKALPKVLQALILLAVMIAVAGLDSLPRLIWG